MSHKTRNNHNCSGRLRSPRPARFMVTLDNLVVTTALPVIRRDLTRRSAGLEWTVNAYTLTFAVLLLTGAALGDRFGRRRMFAIGLAHLHRRLGRGGARAVDRRARRRPRPPGPRRRDRDAAHADDPLGRRARGAPRARARRLGRDQRPRRRVRPARRRRRRLGHLVALDLLAERADRARARCRSRCSGSRRAAAPSGRLDLPGLVLASAGCFGIVWGLVRGNARRLGLARDRRRDRRRRSSCSALFVAWELRAPSADAADALLPQPHLRARERRVAVHVLRDVRLDLPARAVLPDRAGLLAARSPGLRILPWTAMPMLVAPIAGALSDRIGGHRLMGAGLALQAIGPRLDRRGHHADDAVHRPRRARSRSPGSGWRSSSRRSRTSSSRPSGPTRRARPPAPTTRSASSAASSASRCSPRSSRTYGGYRTGADLRARA